MSTNADMQRAVPKSELSMEGVPLIPVFSPDPWHTVATRWYRWSMRFENYVDLKNVTEDKQKRALMLHCVGEEVHLIFETLGTPDELDTFTKAKKKLDEYFNPRRNKEFEVFTFRQATQETNETLDQFYSRLKQLSLNCDFNDRDCEIKSQIIQKGKSGKLRTEALYHPEYTLQDILKLGRTYEATQLHKSSIEQGLQKTNQAGSDSTPNEVNKVYYKNRGRGLGSSGRGTGRTKFVPKDGKQTRHTGKSCYNCGGRWPHQGKCPARDKQCINCKGFHHFAKMCTDPRRPKVRAKGRVNQIQGSPDSDTDQPLLGNVDEEYGLGVLFCLKEEDSESEKGPYHVDIFVNGVKTDFEVDTGASVTLMNEDNFQKLSKGLNPTVNRARQPVLKTYADQTITAVGTSTVLVEYNNQQSNLELVIVPGTGPSLLGRDWLQHIKLDWSNIFHTKQVGNKNCSSHPEQSNQFNDIFSDELGCFNGGKVSIHLKKDAQPVFLKARSVPFSLKSKVTDELDRLEHEGVLSSVDYSEWATPIVPVLKPSGSVRICGDYKMTLNQQAQTDYYPLPHIEELYAKLGGGALYSKLDLSHAYQQLELSQESQKYTTINTHKGLYVYTRLPYGVSCAPGIFQRTLETLLSDIPMCAVYLDDILVSGRTTSEHDQNLKLVLEKLQSSGLHLKREKCMFAQDSVEYLGHKIDTSGIHPNEEKLQGINEAPVPKNISQLRSYIGMLNYYHKFLPNLSSELKPLYDLLRNDTKFQWGKAQDTAFLRSKELMRSSTLLVHYNPELPLLIDCDASPHGLGAVLSHRFPDGVEKPICYASRTLAQAETKYSQVEKEGLAVIFGLKRFHKYIYGRQFEINTDHKPLLGLFSERKYMSTMASSRIQRWALTLGAYQYTLCYKPGKSNLNADALSRLPSSYKPNVIPEPPEIVLSLTQLEKLESPLNAPMISQETRHDPILSQVVQFVLKGWPTKLAPDKIDLKPYFNRKTELSVDRGCLLWGSRVVIPPKYHEAVLSELHDMHPGIVKMKLVSRAYVWWPKLDAAIESTVKNCSSCQIVSKKPALAPLSPWEWPYIPWSRVHIDFAGPLEGKMVLVIIDATSKFMDAHVMSGSSTNATLDKLRHTFALHGLPRCIVSDNGPSFASEDFNTFCLQNGIKHVKVSPYHPASNGLAERAVQTLKFAL